MSSQPVEKAGKGGGGTDFVIGRGHGSMCLKCTWSLCGCGLVCTFCAFCTDLWYPFVI